MLFFTIAIVALTIFLALKYIYSYWDRHGVPNIKPHIPFGNLRAVALGQECFGVALSQLCEQSKGALVGIYLFFRPAILIRDAHLANRIMTTDFNYFHDRGVYCNEQGDPFSAHLFALPGKQWKSLRTKLTPIFTAGQIKGMVPPIETIGHKFQEYLDPLAGRGEVIDTRDLVSRFVLDIVASVFFGFEADCIRDPSDPFKAVLRKVREVRFSTNFRTAGVFVCPALMKITGVSSVPPIVNKFVHKIVSDQIEYREKHDVNRKDFIQQLINLRQENSDFRLTLNQCASNVFLFYAAGADTSTDGITYTLHELSQNLDLMQRVQAEIDEALQKSGGRIEYDVVMGMKLLDLCVKETLRMYPFPVLNRECTKDYHVSESGVVIRKGTPIILSVLAYAMNAEYFPEPERYNPERFRESTKNYDEKAYFPFGDGPRQCIGLRMGLTVVKIGLVMLLSRYNFEATHAAKVRFEPAQIALVARNGIRLKITSRP